MSQEYDNSLRGVLFKNDRKEKETHPDYKGNAEVGGVEYWLSAWIKTPNAGGNKFMSISFQRKDEQQPATLPAPAIPLPTAPPAMPQQNTPQGPPPMAGGMPTGDGIPF